MAGECLFSDFKRNQIYENVTKATFTLPPRQKEHVSSAPKADFKITDNVGVDTEKDGLGTLKKEEDHLFLEGVDHRGDYLILLYGERWSLLSVVELNLPAVV